jgi:hypothetical protein
MFYTTHQPRVLSHWGGLQMTKIHPTLCPFPDSKIWNGGAARSLSGRGCGEAEANGESNNSLVILSPMYVDRPARLWGDFAIRGSCQATKSRLGASSHVRAAALHARNLANTPVQLDVRQWVTILVFESPSTAFLFLHMFSLHIRAINGGATQGYERAFTFDCDACPWGR